MSAHAVIGLLAMLGYIALLVWALWATPDSEGRGE